MSNRTTTTKIPPPTELVSTELFYSNILPLCDYNAPTQHTLTEKKNHISVMIFCLYLLSYYFVC